MAPPGISRACLYDVSLHHTLKCCQAVYLMPTRLSISLTLVCLHTTRRHRTHLHTTHLFLPAHRRSSRANQAGPLTPGPLGQGSAGREASYQSKKQSQRLRIREKDAARWWSDIRAGRAFAATTAGLYCAASSRQDWAIVCRMSALPQSYPSTFSFRW